MKILWIAVEKSIDIERNVTRYISYRQDKEKNMIENSYQISLDGFM